MAAKSSWCYLIEGEAYPAARTALLAEEIELRRRFERVPEQRRALPPRGAVTGSCGLEGPDAPVSLARMFGAKQPPITYGWMFGPERQRPCPMCTHFQGPPHGIAADVAQNTALAVIARSPLRRVRDFAGERSWRNLTSVAIRRAPIAATIMGS